MRATIFGLAFLAVAVPATTEASTVEWFVSHPAERALVIANCRNDPGTAKLTPSCENAEAADQRVSVKRFGRQVDAAGTLIAMCDHMPPLYQIANRCGKIGTR